MQGSFIGCRAGDQTAWSILIVRVVFDDLTVGYCFAYLLYADTPHNALVNSMPGELELVRFDLSA